MNVHAFDPATIRVDQYGEHGQALCDVVGSYASRDWSEVNCTACRAITRQPRKYTSIVLTDIPTIEHVYRVMRREGWPRHIARREIMRNLSERPDGAWMTARFDGLTLQW